jgi:DNA-binding transcriptional LysR family regulator
VIEGSMLDIQQLVRTGVCELALMYGLDLPPDLTPELLYMAWPSVVLHPTHRLASEDAITLSDLSGEPLVLLDTPPSPEYYTSILVNAGVDFSVRFRASSFEMARALVARGFGYSLLIQRPAIDLTYEGLRVITRPVRDPLPGLPLVIVTPEGAAPTRRAKAFAQFCRDSLPFDSRHLSPDPRVPMKG